ncbi:MAG: hypothetical protein H6618_02930 [Deltaproteobacteria bacterium]|nr:hypothetical protein [Deltaproteobacteria bacterium]
MVSEKKRAKLLKRPDKFQENAWYAFRWLASHQAVPLGILLPIVLAAAGIFGWNHLQESQGEQRRAAIAKIDTLYTDSLKKTQETQNQLRLKVKEAEKQLSAALSKKAAASSADKKKTPPEPGPEEQTLMNQIAELQAQISKSTPDYSAVLEQYLAAYQAYPDKPEGWRAGMQAALIRTEEKKFPEAADLLKSILKTTGSDHFYQFQVRMMYIEILEQMEQYQEALEQKDPLLRHSKDQQLPMALLVLGRLELLAGKKDEAAQTFDRIINEHKSSPEARKAMAFRALWH